MISAGFGSSSGGDPLIFAEDVWPAVRKYGKNPPLISQGHLSLEDTEQESQNMQVFWKLRQYSKRITNKSIFGKRRLFLIRSYCSLKAPTNFQISQLFSFNSWNKFEKKSWSQSRKSVVFNFSPSLTYFCLINALQTCRIFFTRQIFAWILNKEKNYEEKYTEVLDYKDQFNNIHSFQL